MKISELPKVDVQVIQDNKPVYIVECQKCNSTWSILLTPKGTIPRGQWKCQMCHPPKSWIKFAKEMEEEMRLCDEQEAK